MSMKLAADFREIARNALRGNWLIAILTGFLASLIGAEIANGGSGGSSSNSDRGNESFEELIEGIQASDFWLDYHTIIIAAAVILVVWTIAMIVISGAGKLGYATFNLKLVDGKQPRISDLFSQFHRLGDGFCMNFLQGLFVALWTLLFVIPGIVKQYSYAMTPYILAENPGMTATEAITQSRYVMKGNKFRLFCLGFSFIGWELLCVAPTLIALGVLFAVTARTGNVMTALLGIIPCCIPAIVGYLFLRPYKEAAYAAFYLDVAGAPEEETPDVIVEDAKWTEI